MIKQIICLHISKLTLLGYVIESCSAQRSRGALTCGGNTHEYPDLGYHHLSPHSHLHCASYRATKLTVKYRGKGLGDSTSPVRGCSGEEPKVGKGKNHFGD